jgi:cytochrome c-type biogenesis protein CcmF
MIVETGHFALILALFVAAVQAVLPLYGAARGHVNWMEVGRSAAVVQFGMIAIALGVLMHAYAVSDFSVLNVAANSALNKPMIYKLSGVWSNHEGSMLLWMFMLSLCGAAVAAFSNNLPPALRARVLAVQGMISVGFLLFILLTSNPFLRLVPPPADGRGLNPVLQDPGLAFHPPFLYLGYVGFSVAFSFAIAALIEGRVDAAWARWVRPWSLASWCALTVGIASGSFWAYYTMGWGGWWFWDPVENASLMPWIAGTALIHSSIVVERRDTLKNWTVLLAIVTFSLSLVGTFLVRSGVLTSVHAFANDPRRGVFILLLLLATVGGSLTLYAVRAPSLAGGGVFAPISREAALVLNNLLLGAAAFTVFIGTLYPLFLDAVGGPKISVGFPFFDETFVPLSVPLLLAVGPGSLLAWKRGDLLGVLQRLWAAFGLALAVMLLATWLAHGGPLAAVAGLGLAAWVFGGAVVELAERVQLFRLPLAASLGRAVRLPRAAWGMTLAHMGLAITVAGIAGSSFSSEVIAAMQPGSSRDLAGYTVGFQGVRAEPGKDTNDVVGTVTIRRDGRPVAVLHPIRRTFPRQQQTLSETAIHTNLLANFYVAIGDQDAQGAWTIRAYYQPLVPWIWLGGLVMAFGGIVSLSDRRWRVGIAKRVRKPV